MMIHHDAGSSRERPTINIMTCAHRSIGEIRLLKGCCGGRPLLILVAVVSFAAIFAWRQEHEARGKIRRG
jgi:hypothetical protein